MTRVTLLQMFNQGLNGILNVQSQQLRTQSQIASGTRILQPADDPVGMAQILRTNDELARIAQYNKNMDSAETSLGLEESQLDAVGNLLVRVRELAINAGDGGLSRSERSAIATELKTRLEELVGLANTRNTSGEYIFGGHQGEQAPFVQSGGSYVYRGDEGQRLAQISATTYVPMGDNGGQIFDRVPMANVPATVLSGSATISQGRITDRVAFEAAFGSPTDTYQINITGFTAPDQYTYDVVDSTTAVVGSGTYTAGEPLTFGGTEFRIVGSPPGTVPAVGNSFQLSPPTTQNVMNTVDRLAQGLESLGDSPEDRLRLDDLIAETLGNLGNAEANVSSVRAKIGARMNTIDSTRDMHSGTDLVNQAVLAEVRDLDYAEALTRLTRENFVLQAAQQSFASISKLSLFNFIR